MSVPHAIHLGFAESGKLAALQGDHSEALRSYRAALDLARSITAPEVFMRHYVQCIMESLEALDAWDEVARASAEALRCAPNQGGVAGPDRAEWLERLGLAQAVLGDPGALDSLKSALHAAGSATAVPVARTVRGWLERRYAIDGERVRREKRKHGVAVVDKDKVDEKRAVPVPASMQRQAPVDDAGRG